MCNAWNHSPTCMCGWGGGSRWVGGDSGAWYEAPNAWWARLPEPSVEAITRKMSEGVSVDERDNRGFTGLIWAAIKGRQDVAELLLSWDAVVDCADNFGQTALYFSTIAGHESISDLLLQHGADRSQRDAANRMLAIERHRSFEKGLEVVVVARDLNAIVQLLDKWVSAGRPPIRLFNSVIDAVKAEHVELLRVLISKGVDVRQGDERGFTPLMWSAIRGHQEITSMLIDAGAPVSKDNSLGRTAQYLAQANGHDKLKFVGTAGS